MKVRSTEKGLGVMRVLYDHLKWLRNRRTPKTIKERVKLIETLNRYFCHTECDNLCDDSIDRYTTMRLKEITRGHSGRRMVNLELCALSAALNWAEKRGLLEVSGKIDLLPHRPAVPKTLSREDAQILIGELPSPFNTMTLLLYHAGLRLSECLHLTWDSVDTTNRKLYIKGKGGRERVVPMSQQVVEALSKVEGREGLVFPSHVTGQAWSDTTLARVIRKAQRRVGLPKAHPHLLRHSAATLLNENGIPIPVIQKFLGHAQISTTCRYIHVSDKQVKESVKEVFD
jgi:site-specific recombinase XerD